MPSGFGKTHINTKTWALPTTYSPAFLTGGLPAGFRGGDAEIRVPASRPETTLCGTGSVHRGDFGCKNGDGIKPKDGLPAPPLADKVHKLTSIRGPRNSVDCAWRHRCPETS